MIGTPTRVISSLSAPTKLEKLTAGSDEKTQHPARFIEIETVVITSRSQKLTHLEMTLSLITGKNFVQIQPVQTNI